MPILSLTKERIEKLLKQIGDREAEIDTLIKLTKEDLWNRDLDAFINEWRIQLEDEAKTRKKAAQMGRRASSKLKIDAKGPAARKRKAKGEDPDDSDYGNLAVAKKPAVVKRAQPKVGLLSHLSPLAKPGAATFKEPAVVKRAPPKAGLLSHLSPLAKPKATTSKAKTQGVRAVSKKSGDVQPSRIASDEDQSTREASDDAWMALDGVSQSKTEAAVAPIFQKAKAAAERKRPAPAEKVESDDEDEEIVRPTISRRPRAAAQKVPTYNLDDSDSNGDDLDFDVGKMVKGIDSAPADQISNSRPLFSASMSRPGSSAGLTKKSSSSAKQIMDIDDDDTDYSKLVPPQASKRGASVTARSMVISDDDIDDDDGFRARVPSPPPNTSKAPRAPKAAAAKATNPKAAASKATEPKTAASKSAKAKAPTAAAVNKTMQSSVQEPKKMPLSPAAKAYAAKKARNAASVLDDDEDEIEKVANEIMDEGEGSVASDADDDDDDLVVRRPARRAAAQAAEKGKKGWGSESEDEDEEEDESEDFEEDDSE